MTPSREYLPPEPEAEPYRGDPRAAVPFPTEGAAPAALPVDPNVPPVRIGDQITPPRANGSGPQPQFYRPGESPPQSIPPRPQLTDEQRSAERYGKIAFGFGIASLVITPILAPIAIVMGVAAIRRGQVKLGRWAIGTGIAGIVLGLILLALISAGVMPTFDEMLDEIRNAR